MLKVNLEDTISAISTATGNGGIGIVRMSGKEAIEIADTIFEFQAIVRQNFTSRK